MGSDNYLLGRSMAEHAKNQSDFITQLQNDNARLTENYEREVKERNELDGKAVQLNEENARLTAELEVERKAHRITATAHISQQHQNYTAAELEYAASVYKDKMRAEVLKRQ